MCNHSYIANYTKKPQSMGKRCPYPGFYERARSTASTSPEVEPPILPIDDSGACLFHSREVSWKRDNDFKGKFLQLVQMLNADETAKHCDFAEFIFVGSELGTKRGSEVHILRLTNTVFRQQAFFIGASFLDSCELEGADFQDGATFEEVIFAGDLVINDTRFRGLDFNAARLMGLAIFTKVKLPSFALFHNAQFTGRTDGYAVKFEDTRFEGLTDFSGAVFSVESSVGFLKAQFEDFTDFGGTQFNCHVVFGESSFTSVAEFIDTSFDTVGSAARYRGAAVEFNGVEVTAGAVLSFMSTDLQNKMFSHDVQMSFKEGSPAGTVRFKNVNISRFTPASKDRLTQLAKLGRVEIGSGCIKYRFQTDLRTISISQGNAPLIVEICQTFANYFTVSNGINLGLEIVERDMAKVSFFYYTDENILEAVFLERLARTEQSLWNLLSIRSEEQLLAVEGRTSTALSTGRENAVINAIDGVPALFGTFFRVGARIAFGAWKESDTKALLGAIRFNDEGADGRALSLHRALVDKYTGRALVGFNRQQNELLSPMVVKNSSACGKLGILFLGANSAGSPLTLEREVKKIQTSLKLAKERDNLVLKQEWAVTVDSLMQAMLDESPTIVHFAGHGDESGIILQNDTGEPKVVSADALSDLFRLFKDTVRCVVLNSCYSEHQAQAIRRHIPYVVGMRSDIPDPAAVAFSTGFYKALGAGKDVPFAFDMGKASIGLEGLFGESIPVLL